MLLKRVILSEEGQFDSMLVSLTMILARITETSIENSCNIFFPGNFSETVNC